LSWFGAGSRNGQKKGAREAVSNYENIRVSQHDGVVTLTLERPEKRNALTPAMIDEILHALDRIEACSCGVMVLTGAGDSFCAGLDLEHLRGLAQKTLAEHQKDSAQVGTLFRRLYDFPKPTIAAVNGSAIAGGAGLVTVCDFSYAVPEAKFGYTEVHIGFVPAIVSSFLIQRAGERVARDLLLTGRIFKAQEAREMGIINGVVEQAELMARAYMLSKQLLGNSPASLEATKGLLSHHFKEQLDAELAFSMDENARMRTEADFLEGISAFLEKRPPKWPSRPVNSKHDSH
jgi:methylglutaconyl-CoA hydratase